jgi:antitoxin component of RelBE/YafQ-DinJ toxin-antitoxin module
MKATTPKIKRNSTLKINTLFRIDAKVKRAAQKAAADVDMSLSSVVNNYLYHFAQNREIAFEYPSPKLVRMIRKSEDELKRGEVSPRFNNAKDAIAWLDAK